MPPTRQSQLVPPSTPPSPYRARYFLDFCFRSNSDTPPPKSLALVNLYHSPLRRNSPGCTIYYETTFLREISVSTRKISFPLSLFLSRIMRLRVSLNLWNFCIGLTMLDRVSRIHLVQRLNSRIDESDEMEDSVINHIAGARVPRVADVTSPPACTVQRHESTLKPRQHPPYESNEPLRSAPFSLTLPFRRLTSRTPVTHWYSREVFRPCETLRKV